MSNATNASGQAGNTFAFQPRLRLRHWLTAAACMGLAGLAHADSSDSSFSEEPIQVASYTADLERQAVIGQTADVGSTAVGLLMGASEANPLGILTLGAKAVAYNQIKEAPPVEQPRLWSMYGAFGWGATANNLCVIATIATGGGAAAICPLIGLGAGMGNWSANKAERDRATFDAMCKDVQARNPQMVCIYTEPTT